MQINCLFWNLGGRYDDAVVASLIAATGANIVAFAECPQSPTELLRSLSMRGVDLHSIPSVACERIVILTTLPVSSFSHKREADRYTMKEVRFAGSLPILFCFVHLQSKLHADSLDQTHSATFFKLDVEAAELEAGHNHTVLVGDFNMNPFDDGMVSAAAMNSVASLQTADQVSRTVQGRAHSFFYNPMWNLLGDFTGPPGTFFHSAPGYRSDFWNTLDQVVLRPPLGRRLIRESLKILAEAGGIALVNDAGRPSVSDHLPLFFSLDTRSDVL